MLPFERRVVAVLTRTDDVALRAEIAATVDAMLEDMPEHLRLGVAGESVLLGSFAWVAGLGRIDDDHLRRRLTRWEQHPVDVIRQYVRLLGSLVRFAEIELAGPPRRVAT